MRSGSPAVQVVGLGNVIRQIKRIEPDLVQELKAANREIAEDVASTGRTLVPRLRGTLGGSIRPGANQRTGLVRAGSKRVPWAGPIHFGWRARNISPDPFLYDALDERRDEVEARYLDAIEKVCRSIT